jgi:hypothetical protein
MALFRRRPLRMRTKRAKRNMLLHFVYGAITIATVSGTLYGVYALTRLPAFTIQNITVEGGPTVSSDTVRYTVERELAGNYFLIIPRRFTYAYPHKKIVETVLSIPRIAAAEVIRMDKQTLHISFKEHTPYALWCDRQLHASTGAAVQGAPHCVFVSASGYAFAEAPLLRGSSFIRYVVENRNPTTATQIFEAERMRAMEAFMEGLKTEFGFRVYDVTLTPDDDVVYHLEKGSSILVTSTMNAQEAFDNLHSVLEAPEFQNLKPGQFDYIDLRFGNRVFVKEEFTAATKDTATSSEALSEEE